MNKTRKHEYGCYLESVDWRDLRNVALARTGGFCQLCGRFAQQVHHVQYPKKFGKEHPHSLIPVCDRCHETSHGIQNMKQLTNVVRMQDFAPTGRKFKYLVSDARVYASAQSWMSALQMPEGMRTWFQQNLSMQAMLKGRVGSDLGMEYESTAVYRWHAVAETLRGFDRAFYLHGFKTEPSNARREIEHFHDKYEQIVAWGYDLQERALANALTERKQNPSAPISQADLLAIVKETVAPRLRDHDDRLEKHDIVIAEVRKAVPIFRDPHEFITVKQAISEQGYDQTELPLYPESKENLAGLTGRLLKDRRVEVGESKPVRLDATAITTTVNTYRRADVYAVLGEIVHRRPIPLPLSAK